MQTKGKKSLHIRCCKALSPKISQLECKCRPGKSINKFKQFDNLLNGVPNWDCHVVPQGLRGVVPASQAATATAALSCFDCQAKASMAMTMTMATTGRAWLDGCCAFGQQLRLSEFKLKCH